MGHLRGEEKMEEVKAELLKSMDAFRICTEKLLQLDEARAQTLPTDMQTLVDHYDALLNITKEHADELSQKKLPASFVRSVDEGRHPGKLSSELSEDALKAIDVLKNLDDTITQKKLHAPAHPNGNGTVAPEAEKHVEMGEGNSMDIDDRSAVVIKNEENGEQ